MTWHKDSASVLPSGLSNKEQKGQIMAGWVMDHTQLQSALQSLSSNTHLSTAGLGIARLWLPMQQEYFVAATCNLGNTFSGRIERVSEQSF